MKIGSLFAGYGGLEIGVQSVLGGTVAWHAEIDKHPAAILAANFPGVPNLGDITQVDWAGGVANGSLAVDVLTGGFP